MKNHSHGKVFMQPKWLKRPQCSSALVLRDTLAFGVESEAVFLSGLKEAHLPSLREGRWGSLSSCPYNQTFSINYTVRINNLGNTKY